MSISRTGECPTFLEYVTKRALIPRSRPTTPQFQQLTRFATTWIDIPSYQRGLVWDDELFEELLDSTSVFIGNAILGAFPVPVGNLDFVNVPPNTSHYFILIDGLQRFSIGNALLTLLFPQVLAANPLRPNDAVHFNALAVQAAGLAAVFQHNDTELENHRRTAVSESYKSFKRMLGSWLESEMQRAGGPAALADRLMHLFLIRQIAPDSYYGFAGPYDVTKTFIGLNTIRVQLSIVDWLRSLIIDQGGQSWNPSDIERIENRFTDVFTHEGRQPETELVPFAAIIKNAIENPSTAGCVFPSWQTGLLPDDVELFLNFVEEMHDYKANHYLRELRCCGAIPFAACLAYYYKRLLSTGNRPSFLSGGALEDAELLQFLRANYRVLFDGRIGRTRQYAEKLLTDQAYILLQAAEEISQQFVVTPLAQQVDRSWLISTLKQTDRKRAGRVFNACLLPLVASGATTFTPHWYGTRTTDYQVDHLIPESGLTINEPGEPEGRLLTNLAPVRRSANNRQTNLQCSAKLGPGGSYESEIANDPKVHPYVRWLVASRASHVSFLDDQTLLQPNSNPPIGAERIAQLADQLIPRL
jgi:hypothetical protein